MLLLGSIASDAPSKTRKKIEIWNKDIRTEGGTEREKPRCESESERERERENRDGGEGGPGGGEKGAVAQEKGRLFSMESTPTSWRDAGGQREREQTKTSLAGWMQTGQLLRNDGQLQGLYPDRQEKERRKKSLDWGKPEALLSLGVRAAGGARVAAAMG